MHPFHSATVLDPRRVRDIASDVLDEQGQLRILPAAYYRSTSAHERTLFGVRHGHYLLPTLELVDWLKAFIGGRSAIEIGAGNGVLARALGIPATDSRMQEDPAIAAYYQALGQPVVSYGENVEKLDASQALDRHKPQVVVASWVTHRYSPSRHEAGGNERGVEEEVVIRACEAYVFIGNSHVHAPKSIWSLPHRIIEQDFVFSRAGNGSPDFLAVWER